MAAVAVTGANGFVGSHVVRELLRRGHEVAALIGADVGCENLADVPVKPRALDLLDPESVRAGLAGCDSVIHTAACYSFWLPDPRDFYRINVDGTANVLAAARSLGLRKLVYTSTGATLAAERAGFRGHYRASKAAGERLVLDAAASGFPAVVVHPTTVLGPGDRRPTPTGTLIVHFLARRMVVFIEMEQNVVHVDDVAAGHALALEHGVPGAHYVLGGDNLSMRELVGLLSEITGIPAPRFALPNSLVLAVGAASEWLADHVTHRPPVVAREAALHARDATPFDLAKTRAELGYAPRPAREVLEDAVRWFARAQ
ncbi:MAG: NAD-dependent epimerase/dehydratase family protein [Myxococcota bacterium]